MSTTTGERTGTTTGPRMRARVATLAACVGAVGSLALMRCSTSNDSKGVAEPGVDASSGNSGNLGAGGAVFGTGGSGGVGLPPEQELEASFQSPVATRHYVWAANPTSGRVALINATTLDVRTLEAGFGPTYLAALPNIDAPDGDAAIVINVLSHDATAFFLDASGQTTSPPPIALHVGANAWATSASGRWAIAWSDVRHVQNPDPLDGFQDVTVVDLSKPDPEPTRLSVGFRPSQVVIDTAEDRAFAVTEAGISVIDLGASPPAALLDVAVSDSIDDPATRDVSILADGSTALVRHDGSPDVTLVTLTSGDRKAVTLSGAVTDLDVTGDGTLAVAVVRDRAQIALLPLPGVVDGTATPEVVSIPGEVFGSVALSKTGSKALLYTNAVANDHLTIVDLAQATPVVRTVALNSPVEAVFPADDGANAVALLNPAAGSSKKGAFSVIPLDSNLPPRLQGTDAPPTAVAIAPAPDSRAIVTVRDDASASYGAYFIQLPEQRIDFTALASAPLATGMVLGGDVHKGYVVQLHPEGRVTFFTLIDGSARTLTGFELGSKIIGN